MLSSTAVKRAAGKRKRRPIREVKPPPPEQLELDARTAADLYDLRDHVRGELVNDSITVLRGSSRVPGDLSLDLDDEDGCDGTIIDGELRVTGTVVNRDSERGRITDDDHFRSYAPALVDAVLAAGGPPGGHPDWDRTSEAILAGRPVLREGVVLNRSEERRVGKE